MSDVQQAATGPTRTSHRYNLISATMAFVLWGTWAYYVNTAATVDQASASPLSSGLTQGTGSFIITLVMVRAVAWLYRHLPTHRVRLLLPALIVVSVTGSCLAIAHTLVGTPNIVRTIAPALTVAFIFNIYTAAKLRREERAGMGKMGDAIGGRL